jgi:tRNA 2-thiouridine synthesizing protein C
MSKYLFIISEPPFTSNATQDALELAIGFATLEATITVLFLGSACLQLQSNLNPTLTGFSYKSIGIIPSLSTYGINNIYILQEDLTKFNLNSSDLNIAHQVITKNNLHNLYLEHNFILYSSSRS